MAAFSVPQPVKVEPGKKTRQKKWNIRDDPITWQNWYKHINWLHTPVLISTPIIAIYGFYTTKLQLYTAIWAIAYYFITGLGITAGYHRLWAHRAYKASRPFEIFLIFAASGAVEGSIRWWCRDHRSHHRWTDTDSDPYNAHKGLFYSHLGWMLLKQNPNTTGRADISDLSADPLIMLQSRYYGVFAIVMGFIFPTAVAGFYFATICRLVFVHHATFCVNSLAHYLGDTPFDDRHTPRDHFITAFFSLGEGYHNFHHEFPGDYRNAIRFYQYDPTKWLIKTLSYFGIVHHLKTFPENEIKKGQIIMCQKKLDYEKKTIDWGKPLDQLPIYTYEEYEKNAKSNNWICIEGIIHDITDFMEDHPGGKAILIASRGEDMTNAFNGGVYDHSNAARNLLSSFRIGVISGGGEVMSQGYGTPQQYGQQQPGQPPYGQQHGPPPQVPPGADSQLWFWFQAVDTDRSGALTTEELQKALINGDWSPFNIETVRLMMNMFDTEFAGLWRYIEDWKKCFTTFDADGSGTINFGELKNAMKTFGYNLSDNFINLLIKKYDKYAGNKTGKGDVTFDNFVQSCVTVKTLTDSFRRYDTDNDGWILINYEQEDMAAESKIELQPPLSPFGNAVAGSLGALIALFITYPLDITKTRLQVQSKSDSSKIAKNEYYHSTKDALYKIISSEGISGLYAGLPAGLIGVASTNFAYFYWYSLIRSYYQNKRSSSSLSTTTELILGAFAGALAQIFTIPVSVITTRQQTTKSHDRKDLIGTTKEIISEDGITGLWKGLKPSLILCVNPAITYGALSKTIATIFTYPYIMAKVRLQWKPPKSDLKDGIDFEECEEDSSNFKRNIKYKGAIDVLRKVLATDGVQGWYKS
ncbi:13530_t:CDS:10 [Dentiscutata erythropus]|uniref:13530_t:CDS:1 n=1 Tax=Dentiscutata erythropus TaxID=1348616 RepID=A0A9N8YZE2_9GLOM|nr:13530_t:CDS:10 [Dentiscutata erythropus]